MKIDVVLNHKEYQPRIEGLRGYPDAYKITIERSDGVGLTKHEALTVLQTCINGMESGRSEANDMESPKGA